MEHAGCRCLLHQWTLRELLLGQVLQAACWAHLPAAGIRLRLQLPYSAPGASPQQAGVQPQRPLLSWHEAALRRGLFLQGHSAAPADEGNEVCVGAHQDRRLSHCKTHCIQERSVGIVRSRMGLRVIVSVDMASS